MAAHPPPTQDSDFPIKCQGTISFWDDTEGIEQAKAGPFVVGTRIRIQSLANDPMALGGKVGTVAWLVPGGASVQLDGEVEKVKVQDAAMMQEVGVHAERAHEVNARRRPAPTLPLRQIERGRTYKSDLQTQGDAGESQIDVAQASGAVVALVVHAGVKNNPCCEVEIDSIQLNDQSLSSRDPFKWAENGALITVVGTIKVTAKRAAYSTQPYQPAPGEGSACCSLQ
eukprot:CAMPEP_0179417922 /NCGR_PEP_ID=MMETSP0799-20121207/7650_1 /TAXON_ID=46947 /ORGANISM="Geminigera cryophila, Strain CCMP2564" /LENGTH=226 /DNA_ID=CAMNT_0021191013 /DNA_START=123 /DNA_END=804 /DNA_ORIENTATION=-